MHYLHSNIICFTFVLTKRLTNNKTLNYEKHYQKPQLPSLLQKTQTQSRQQTGGNDLFFQKLIKQIIMYNLETFNFVSVDTYTETVVLCTIENEDNGALLQFSVNHDNIADYLIDCGIREEDVKINRNDFEADKYDDICSNLFIDLKESENSESISGLHVRQFKTNKGVFSEHEIASL